jgi:hypothetical protein
VLLLCCSQLLHKSCCSLIERHALCGTAVSYGSAASQAYVCLTFAAPVCCLSVCLLQKTTLCKALAGRLPVNRICGDVRLLCSSAADAFQAEVELTAAGTAGGAAAACNISQMTGFVPQFDQLHETLTVRCWLSGTDPPNSQAHLLAANLGQSGRHDWLPCARGCLLAVKKSADLQRSTLDSEIVLLVSQVLENLLLAAKLRLPVSQGGQGGCSTVSDCRRTELARHRDVHKVVGEVMALMALTKVATTVSVLYACFLGRE